MHSRLRGRLLVILGVLAIVGAACGGSSPTAPSPQGSVGASATGGETGTRGGTLKIALQSDVRAAFDPQKEYYGITWEFYRCCLLRTLMSYNGKTTAEGGTDVRPDLAAAPPEVSSDGLTWTFKLKPGIHYAPPVQNETVTAGDIVRALEREACAACAASGYSFYYSVIKGFDDYAAGKAKSIAGLQAPDDSTLVVTLDQPAGDLPFRFAMAATAPIPPNPSNPSAKLGVAQGHDANYGRFFVATGPYMIQGADQVDFSQPPKSQKPSAGYVPGKSIALVRNPSWDASTDDLRPAYPDQIDVTITTASVEDLANQVDAGTLDLVMDGVVPTDQLQKYAEDPNLKDQVHINPSDAVRYIEMNLALPPFDDIHVRRAVNYAIDKDGLRALRGGPAFGEIANHVIVNSLENDALKDYDPYPTDNGKGNISKAKAEMRQSKYDSNGDGVCDADVCKNVLTIVDQADPYPQQSKLIIQNLAPLGITLDIKSFERTTMYQKCEDPTTHFGICTSPSWGKDYADAFTFGPPLFSSTSIGPNSCCNDTLVGVPPTVLKKLQYQPAQIPSVDDQLAKCSRLTGDQRVSCWADLDKKVMQDVVPWVPYIFDNRVDVTSSRVHQYSFDQFAGLAALDRLSIGPSS
jgi:peptide/nickel transport system substrate-binding protein